MNYRCGNVWYRPGSTLAEVAFEYGGVMHGMTVRDARTLANRLLWAVEQARRKGRAICKRCRQYRGPKRHMCADGYNEDGKKSRVKP